ncbi:MAG: hypothetical protein JNL34_01965 [Anaerolineae bacterium]|nr:hypothetical protein [Anaerolineae bacterium]
MLTEAQLKSKRDDKAMPTLDQYAPVYVTDEMIDLEAPAILFDAAFQHNLYGWVSRRYLFDGFNNVLYYKGQVTLSEEQALALEGASSEPYVSGVAQDTPNAYGG